MKLSVQIRISLTQPSSRSTVSIKIRIMKPILITLLCFTLFILACEKTAIDPPHFKENAVQLSNLKAGQLSQFLRYTTNCNEMESNFEWSQDTLNLRVIEKNDQLYFEESLTPHSPMFLSGAFVAVEAYLAYDPYQLYLSHVITIDEFNGTRFEYIQGWYLLLDF